jgi:hypothetical protein
MTRQEVITQNLELAQKAITRIKRRMAHFYKKDYSLTTIFDSEKVLRALLQLETKISETESYDELKKRYKLK